MVDIWATIITGVIAALPGIALGIAAYLKSGIASVEAMAAASSAKWDDEAVAFVEKIAKTVFAGGTVPPVGADH